MKPARAASPDERPARPARAGAGKAKPTRTPHRMTLGEIKADRPARTAGPDKPTRSARTGAGETQPERPVRSAAPGSARTSNRRSPGEDRPDRPVRANRPTRSVSTEPGEAKPARLPRSGAEAATARRAPFRPKAGAPTKPAVARKPAPKPRKPVRKGDDSTERLQKILAHAGVASRRACEAMILEGRVQVNGVTVTELGAKADPRRDQITLDLQPLTKEAPVYILINKPKGYVTTVKDDEGRPTVMALLHGVPERVYPVGRLDFQSEGLLLMTNDGAMAQHLMSPENHIPKVYLVKVHRTPRAETLDEMREGFLLDGRRLKPCGIEFHDRQDNPWLKIVLIEGKNQQIRKMFAAVGHPVHKLRRIQFGPLDDPFLKPGEWRYLNPQELAALKSL